MDPTSHTQSTKRRRLRPLGGSRDGSGSADVHDGACLEQDQEQPPRPDDQQQQQQQHQPHPHQQQLQWPSSVDIDLMLEQQQQLESNTMTDPPSQRQQQPQEQQWQPPQQQQQQLQQQQPQQQQWPSNADMNWLPDSASHYALPSYDLDFPVLSAPLGTKNPKVQRTSAATAAAAATAATSLGKIQRGKTAWKRSPPTIQAADAMKRSDMARWHRLQSTSCDVVCGSRGAMQNSGNTCFLASLLQTLFHTQHFDAWAAGRQCNCEELDCVSCLMGSTYRNCMAPGSIILLDLWTVILNKLGLEFGVMHDPGELLKLMLARWAECPSTVRRADYTSFMHGCELHWRLKRTVTARCWCTEALGRTTEADFMDSFLDLQVGGGVEPTSLQRLLDHHLEACVVESDSVEDTCPKCKTTCHVLHAHLVRRCEHCDMMGIVLKRGLLNGSMSRRVVKIDDLLWIAGKKFRLSSLVVNLGGEGGHYIAWARSRQGYHIYNDATTLFFRSQVSPDIVDTNAVMAVYEALSTHATVISTTNIVDMAWAMMDTHSKAYAAAACLSFHQAALRSDMKHREMAELEADEDALDQDDPDSGEATLEEGRFLSAAQDSLVRFHADAEGRVHA